MDFVQIGMLWYDDDPKRSLPDKVRLAALYYREKYGIIANLCFVHRSMMQGFELVADGIVIHPSQQVLPNYLWIGREAFPEALPEAFPASRPKFDPKN